MSITNGTHVKFTNCHPRASRFLKAYVGQSGCVLKQAESDEKTVCLVKFNDGNEWWIPLTRLEANTNGAQA